MTTTVDQRHAWWKTLTAIAQRHEPTAAFLCVAELAAVDQEKRTVELTFSDREAFEAIALNPKRVALLDGGIAHFFGAGWRSTLTVRQAPATSSESEET